MSNKTVATPLLGKMKQFSLFFTLILCSYFTTAQEIDHRMEFGVMGGLLTYSGDLNTGANIHFRGPAGGAFYRHNYKNNISVLRFNVLVGKVSGNENVAKTPLQNKLNRSFSTIVTEFSGLYEYNFFDFRKSTGRESYPICPYLFGGLGVGLASVSTGETATYVALPFGGGVKFKVGDKLNLGIEFGARKVFSDKIDAISNTEDLNSSSNQDWYYFTGLTFSYTKYVQMCPRSAPKSRRKPSNDIKIR